MDCRFGSISIFLAVYAFAMMNLRNRGTRALSIRSVIVALGVGGRVVRGDDHAEQAPAGGVEGWFSKSIARRISPRPLNR